MNLTDPKMYITIEVNNKSNNATENFSDAKHIKLNTGFEAMAALKLWDPCNIKSVIWDSKCTPRAQNRRLKKS